MGKSGGKFRVAEYYMSLHVGVCTAGRGVELLEVKMGDKIAWEGNLRQNNVVRINRPNLFGGQKKEGGVKGLLWWLNGNENQRLPAALSNRLGYTPANCPGFRGLASFFLTGFKVTSEAGLPFFWPNFQTALANEGVVGATISEIVAQLQSRVGGFLLGANNPYLKTISARVRRAPEGLSPGLAMIRIQDSSTGKPQYAANAAHIVFECMTDPTWGMGESYGAFNIASFEECAQTLYDEQLGLCMLWTRQSSIEDFIKDVLDHVQGAVFVDPATGKHTMKLLRGDYDVDSLPVINPDNAKLSNFKRRVWGEISNEVVVTWTNPETGKEETVTAQDLGAIAAQGGVVSTGRNYHGLPSQDMALAVAERDLAALVHPIITLDAEVTREFWKSITYGVIALNWPKYGIDRAIFRISKVSNGSTSRTIRLSLYEDVFALDKASYLGSPDTGWTDPSSAPTPLESVYLGTAPAFMAAAVLGLEDPGQIPYPQTVSLLLAAPDTIDDIGYELVTTTTNVVGETVVENLGERPLNATWLLADDLAQEARSFIDRPIILGTTPRVGDFLFFDGGSDEESEIAVIRNLGASTMTIDRGLLDTTPKAWLQGTRVFVIPSVSVAPDDTPRVAFEEVRYRLLTKTSLDTLAIEDAPNVDAVLSERAHLPLRPANVRVRNVPFGTATMPALDTEVEITWANRNRSDESTQVILWPEASINPEPGQTTSIIVMHAGTRAVITAITGLTGTSHSLPRSALDGNSSVIIKVVAVRDGQESLQGHEIGLIAL